MKARRAVLAAAAFLAASVVAAPLAIASDVTGIGYVDETQLGALPQFAAANRDLAAYKAQLDGEFASAARGAGAASQERLASELSRKLAQRQSQLFDPLFARAQTAIASVASSRNLSVILDKRIVVFGGTDITKDVADLLTDVAAPVPPVSSPPPSNVGFVDQAQIDAVPSLKAANDAFAQYADAQNRDAQAKMRGAKSDADRRAILAAMQKNVDAKRRALIEPLVQRTRGVIATIANKRAYVLVVDRSSLVYGGVDITSDVVAALK